MGALDIISSQYPIATDIALDFDMLGPLCCSQLGGNLAPQPRPLLRLRLPVLLIDYAEELNFDA